MTTVTDDLAVLADSTHRLMDTLAAMRPEQVEEPSRLPGWTRGHVLTHLARSADALVDLLRGARLDERIAAYPGGPGTRESDIAAGAGRPLEEQLADLRTACGRFVEAVSLVPEAAWGRTVPHPRVSGLPAHALPRLRIAEVEFHHVDLGLGYSPADWPAEFTGVQLSALAARYRGDAAFPALLLVDAGSGAELRLGRAGAPERVSGSARALVAWLSGRSDGAGLSVPGQALPAVPPLA